MRPLARWREKVEESEETIERWADKGSGGERGDSIEERETSGGIRGE